MRYKHEMARTSSTPAPLPQIKPHALRGFHQALAQWYAAHGRRDLPWRNTDDPYAIWVSEVMLQQTQVSTVLARFYFPFLKKFPTVEALAKAPRESVMKAWEGLGYYRRAGFLHEAAKKIIEGDFVPFASSTPCSPSGSRSFGATQTDINALLDLPGIGRNTAHAILAFGYHQPVAILEANVKRVVARIFALKTPSDAQLWEGAEVLLNKSDAFDYNQAMMDIGAMVCTPKNPRCVECPAHVICLGKSSPEMYPSPKMKKKIPTRHMAILVQQDAAGRYLLEQRDAALLGGLWGFTQEAVTPAKARVQHNKNMDAGLRRHDEYVGSVTHLYSHFRLEGSVYLQLSHRKERGNTWFSREEIAALPLSKVDHKVLALIDARHSKAANSH